MCSDIIAKTTACVDGFKAGCNDCELIRFIDLFMDQYASGSHDHNQLKIMVAKGNMQSYIPLLTTSLRDVKTIFGCCSGHPCLTIRSGNTDAIKSLDLSLIHNMHIETIDTPGCPWVRYNMTFNYMDLVDYDMSLFLYH